MTTNDSALNALSASSTAPDSPPLAANLAGNLSDAIQELIEAELTVRIGAEPNERILARPNLRNGHRDKLVSTPAGDITVGIPTLRKGSILQSPVGVVRPDLPPVGLGEALEGQHVTASVGHGAIGLVEPVLVQQVGDFVPAVLDLVGVGEREVRPTPPPTSVGELWDLAEKVAGVVDPASLPRCSLEAAPDGCFEAFVGVGDHQADPAQSPFLQRPQEPGLERLVLRIADVDTENFPITVGGDPSGDHDRSGDDLAQVVVMDMHIGRIQRDVREPDTAKVPASERGNPLVEAGADPGHLGLGNRSAASPPAEFETNHSGQAKVTSFVLVREAGQVVTKQR